MVDNVRLWQQAKIRTATLPAVNRAASLVVHFKERYKAAEAKVSVPWYVIGAIHSLEADFNFNTILANGDPLNRRTTHVPRGLIAHTWEEGVVISFVHEGFTGLHDWTLTTILNRLEAYNGPGYRYKGLPSAYLWACTTVYSHGKYLADGQWSSSAVSTQVGAAAILLRLVDLGVLKVDGDKVTEVEQSPGAAPAQGLLDLGELLSIPGKVLGGALAGAGTAVAGVQDEISHPVPKATINPVEIVNPHAGISLDPAKVLAQDVIATLSALIAFAGAQGMVTDWTAHWLLGTLTAGAGTIISALTLWLKRRTAAAVSENVQHNVRAK